MEDSKKVDETIPGNRYAMDTKDEEDTWVW
jgi:hypothetical protein